MYNHIQLTFETDSPNWLGWLWTCDPTAIAFGVAGLIGLQHQARLYFYFTLLEIKIHYADLADLELSMYTRLKFNSQYSASLCLPNAVIKAVCQFLFPAQTCRYFLLILTSFPKTKTELWPSFTSFIKISKIVLCFSSQWQIHLTFTLISLNFNILFEINL